MQNQISHGYRAQAQYFKISKKSFRVSEYIPVGIFIYRKGTTQVAFSLQTCGYLTLRLTD